MDHNEALRKAMSCLRLAARAGTPEEAAVAASKAQKIIDDYKLDVTGLDYEVQEQHRESEQVQDFRDDPLGVEDARYNTRWCGVLAVIIARANQCRVVYGYKTFDGKKPIHIFGRPSDVQTARYLYAYFKNEVLRISDLICTGNSNTYKSHFRLGVVDIIAEHLKRSQEATLTAKRNENPLALVRVNQAIARIERRALEVEKFVEKLYGTKLKKARRTSARCDSAMTGRTRGQLEGKKNLRFTSGKAALGSGRAQIGGGQ